LRLEPYEGKLSRTVLRRGRRGNPPDLANKLGKTAEEALAQIDTKEYLLPWKERGKKLFKVGVSFDPKKRNIGEWKVSKTR